MKLAERRQLNMKRQLYYVALGSFLLVLIWIGFEIYWAYQRTEEIVIDQANLTPIDTELYTETANSLSDRRVFTQEELDNYLDTLEERLAQFNLDPTPVTSTGSASTPTGTSIPFEPPETTNSSQVES